MIIQLLRYLVVDHVVKVRRCYSPSFPLFLIFSSPVLTMITRAKPNHLIRVTRYFSTPAPPLTAEEIAKYEDLAKKHRKFKELKVSPQSFALGITGTDADIEKVPEKNIADVAALNGMPADHANRTVIISQHVRKSQQSGNLSAHLWSIKWKHKERWANPLMGWTSSADTMSSVQLSFNTKEDAINFAKKQGWKFELKMPTVSRTVEMGEVSYADNFLPPRVKEILKEEGMKNTVFVNPNYGKSNWFMPLKYHGEGEVIQFGPPPSAAPASASKPWKKVAVGNNE